VSPPTTASKKKRQFGMHPFSNKTHFPVYF
jgi:hypothetical protein